MEYIVKEYDTRYFAGIELIGGFKVGSEDHKKVPGLWDDLASLYLEEITEKERPIKKVGLEIYRVDFMESKMVDYFATVQTNGLIDVDDESLVTKKLPKGEYILFPMLKDDYFKQVKKIYRYIQHENIDVHLGFHVEVYQDETLDTNDKTMYLSFKLEE